MSLSRCEPRTQLHPRRALARLLPRLRPRGGSVLDLGCGTGTFAISLAASRPDAEVIGIDGDPEILELAQAKDGADAVEWREGLAGALPFEEGASVAGSLDLLAARDGG